MTFNQVVRGSNPRCFIVYMSVKGYQIYLISFFFTTKLYVVTLEKTGESMGQSDKRKVKQRQMEARRLARRKKRKRQTMFLCLLLLIIILSMILMVMQMMNSNDDHVEDKRSSTKETAYIGDSITDSSKKAIPEPTPTPIPVTIIPGENIHSGCGYLVRLSDQAVVMDKGSTDKIYPAPLTKIMTIIVAIENLPNLDDQIMLSDDVINTLYTQGAAMTGFVGGENLTVRDLLYGSMISSGAESCVGLAQRVSGSEEAFVDRMNQKAAELSMNDTHFETCTGLPGENNYSTCKDIANMFEYALRNNTFREIFTSAAYTTSVTPPHPNGLVLENTILNNLKENSLSNGGLIEGGKESFTNSSGQCLASLSKIGQEEYILVTAKSDGSPGTEQYHISDAFTAYNLIH